MADNQYFDEYFNKLMGAQKAGFEKEKFNIYEYLMNLGQRQGIGGAMLQASRATAPYAEEFAKNAANASADATRLAEDRARFEKEYAQRLAEFEERKRQFDEQQAQENSQFTAGNQISMFPYTGWNQQLANSLGYTNYTGGNGQFSNTPLNTLGYGTNAAGGSGSGTNANAWYNQAYGPNHPLAKQANLIKQQQGSTGVTYGSGGSVSNTLKSLGY